MQIKLIMTLQSNRRGSDFIRNQKPSQTKDSNLNQIIAAINRKKLQIKKALSKIQSSAPTASLHYIYSNSNSYRSASLHQKQLIQQENLARGSVQQLDQHNRQKKIYYGRNKYEKSKVQRKLSQKLVPQLELYRSKTQAKEEEQPTLKRSIFLQPMESQIYLPKFNKRKESDISSRLRLAVAEINRFGKKNEKLQKLYTLLCCFNPFFAKIGKVIGVCILRVGDIFEVQPDDIFSELQSRSKCFYLILEGQVKLKGSEGMQKICETGQSFLQQILFSATKDDCIAFQRSKATKKGFMLCIQKQNYQKLMQQLFKFGYKQGAMELQCLFKRNYIVKNWLRNKLRKLYNT